MSATRLSERTRAAAARMALESAPARVAMKGSSMLPDLREGMEVELAPARRMPCVGDIVVFGAGERLVAHRVVRILPDALICAGDAQPDCLERVDSGAIAGIVERVYDANGNRCDDWVFRLRGAIRARTRAVRSVVCLALPHLRPQTYRVLVDAMSAAVRGNPEDLRKAIAQTAPWRLAAVARRHRCAAALCTALSPLKDDEYAAVLQRLLQRDRWIASLRAVRLRAQILEVVRTIRNAGVEPVLLKGAHRTILSFREAEMYDSSDIDVLVPAERVEDACEALKRSQYAQTSDTALLRTYEKHHHAAPLFPRDGVSVEIHHALTPLSTGVPRTWAELTPFIVEQQADGGTFVMLNNVGYALHLALHCLQRPPLRDLVLLATQLRAMDEYERARLRGIFARESTFAVALGAAVAFAAQMADIPWDANPAQSRYARWMKAREDLPRPLRAHTECFDAYASSSGSPFAAACAAAFDKAKNQRALRGIARLLAGIACAMYGRLMPR